jgi:hypothetical protein
MSLAYALAQHCRDLHDLAALVACRPVTLRRDSVLMQEVKHSTDTDWVWTGVVFPAGFLVEVRGYVDDMSYVVAGGASGNVNLDDLWLEGSW